MASPTPIRLLVAESPSQELTLRERTDDELMLLGRGGDPDAFETLVRRYQRFALSAAYKYLGQTGAAKDAAQNAFVELFGNLNRYRAQGKFRGYFWRIVINQCRMMRRKTRSQERLRDAAAMALVPDISAEEMLVRERGRDIERALRRLSDKLLTVVVLRFSGGLTHPEIADVLDVPVGTVKSRLFAALEKLRRMLEEE